VTSKTLKNFGSIRNHALLFVISCASLLVEGYHPGVEDDAVYLSAIQRRLHPALYPHDFHFFTLQMQASVFDRIIAAAVRLTHIPVSVAELLGQFLAAYFLLWGCWSIARRCFPAPAGQWAGVALVGVLFSMPVAGTALYIFDQYLHPRAIATALILAAIVAVLESRITLAATLLLASVVMHPIMGAFGVSFCAILLVAERWRLPSPARPAIIAGFATPLWIFEGPTPAWRQALSTRSYYFLSQWTWYELLGAIAPILILWLIAHYAKHQRRPVMSRLAIVAAIFAVFQFVIAAIIMLVPSLVRVLPMQPMRYLHLVYIFMALLGGGILGEKLLRAHSIRWIIVFLPLATCMFVAQRALFRGTPHLELPGISSRNPWLKAFAWAHTNTPNDAYFALDPYYMDLSGEDYHSFRALAQRSQLADAVKDPAVASQVPELAPLWQQQTQAVAGWRSFTAQDFQRLHQQFGVDWIVVHGSGAPGRVCPYRNEAVAVCRL
jgi:hypothetical protein